jgi:HEAT repeat protein
MQPTPDYVVVGAGSNATGFQNDAAVKTPRWLGPLLAISTGIGMAVALYCVTGAMTARRDLSRIPFSRSASPSEKRGASARDLQHIDTMKPQAQAETLLEAAVGRSDGAVEQISVRAARWNGRVQWTSQIATLTTAALNSDDMRVRESGVEVEMAAYGLSKNQASLDYVVQTANSPDEEQKIWALWALGLLANRGVDPDRVVSVLTDHLQDSDVEARHWAVEGLAVSGAEQAIEPLLKAMHDDSSSVVRERAACALAESGLFTPQQRFSAIPQLLAYTDDASLDAQTHAWAFQALGDITHQHLPNDPAAWREWYSKQ